MYDPTFHAQTLKKELRHGDFVKDKNLFDQSFLDGMLERAEYRARQGYLGVSLNRSKIRKDDIFQFANLEDEIVSRKIVRNIKRVTRVQQSDRDLIVSCIECLCREGLPIRIYKIDIESFYKNIPLDQIISRLRSDVAFSGDSISLVESLFQETKIKGISGLPRGLSLSATLSEYLMRTFDRAVSRLPNACFYSRFVDDIIFITHGSEDSAKFIELVKGYLPDGLKLHPKKTKEFNFSAYHKKNKDSLEGSFDFLGYEFFINYAVRNSDNCIERKIRVDIAGKKVKRIKTRVIRSAIMYINDKNFVNFEDRIKILTSNYKFLDTDKKTFRNAGIYFNYRKIEFKNSEGLPELDLFLKKFLLAKDGPVGSRLSKMLSTSQRKSLLSYSFKTGFEKKIFFAFNGTRLSELRSCWRYA